MFYLLSIFFYLLRINTDQLASSESTIIELSQYGFCKDKSTLSNLLEFTTSNSYQTDFVYTDFSKAIDSVSYSSIHFKHD